MVPFRSASFLVALIVLTGSVALSAKTLTFDQEKCQIKVPDDWSSQNVEGNKLSYVNADQTKSFTMRIVDTGKTVTLDNAAFVQGFEGSMTKNGLTITDRQHVQIDGIDAYAVDSTQLVNAGTVYNRMIVTLANGNAYGLNTSKLNAKPSDDDQLNGIVKSFAFIGVPEVNKAEDPMDKVGYYIGVFVGVLAVISIFKWILRPKKSRS